MYINMKMSNNINNLCFALRLGSGVSSTMISLFAFPLLQFPLTGFNATEPCSLSDTVFFKKVATVGLSLAPPCILCFPKKLSSGSWQNFSVRTYLTPLILRRKGISSTIDITIYKKNIIVLEVTHLCHKPVILSPSSVSFEMHNLFFSVSLRFSVACALASHSSK